MCKILELCDQNPWRNDLSKWGTFDSILQRPHSAVVPQEAQISRKSGEKLKSTSRVRFSFGKGKVSRFWFGMLSSQICSVSADTLFGGKHPKKLTHSQASSSSIYNPNKSNDMHRLQLDFYPVKLFQCWEIETLVGVEDSRSPG